MILSSDKVLSGKYAGTFIVLDDDTKGFSVGNKKNAHKDVKSVDVVGSINKVDVILSINPVKTYYNVNVTWYSGGESLMEVSGKVLNMLNAHANANAQWRAMTPTQKAQAKKEAEMEDAQKEKMLFIGIVVVGAIFGLMILLGI